MVWRRLRLHGNTSLADLHHIIQVAMSWDNDHLHCFHIYGEDYGIKYDDGLKANELAIQVLGGSGYIREYPVEQHYRDQRLNPIHEGTEAIHGIDLLGRKVAMGKMAAYQLFTQAVEQTLADASQHQATEPLAASLGDALQKLDQVTGVLLPRLAQDPDRGLANATLYLDVFGRIVASWIWLKQASIAASRLEDSELHSDEAKFYRGKLQAARYYLEWELPEIAPQIALLQGANTVPFDMQDDWF